VPYAKQLKLKAPNGQRWKFAKLCEADRSAALAGEVRFVSPKADLCVVLLSE